MKRLHRIGLSAYTAGLFVVIVCAFGGLCALWLSGRHETYFWLMGFLGAPAWERPFLDLTGVISWGECHRAGYDVLRINPCDPLNRPLNYGPILVHLPFGVRDTNLLGAIQDGAFLVSLPFVLAPRTLTQFAVAAAAILSSATLYALERANLDVFEFVLIALAGLVMTRGRVARLFSYALYFVGGMTKFYPFALLLLVLRERPRMTLALSVAAALAIGLYAAHYRSELIAIGSLLPPFEYDTDVFGAYILGLGGADVLELPQAYAALFTLMLAAGFGAFAWRLAAQLRHKVSATDWNGIHLHFLLAGAIVLVGCFFTQTNMDYRGIFLLFALAGLFDLRDMARGEPLGKIFAIAIAVLLFCLWSEFFRLALERLENAIAPGHPDSTLWNLPQNLFFIARELAWWWLISVLASAILAFMLSSPSFARIESVLRPRKAGGSA